MKTNARIIVIGLGILWLTILAGPQPAGAAESTQNLQLLETYVHERDEAIHDLLAQWFMEQKPTAELKPLGRKVSETEVLIMNLCNNASCYETNSVLYGARFSPQSLPAVLLERVYHLQLDPARFFLNVRFKGEGR